MDRAVSNAPALPFPLTCVIALAQRIRSASTSSIDVAVLSTVPRELADISMSMLVYPTVRDADQQF
jgi:hypothetical protein